MTYSRHMPHAGEAWMIQESAQGGWYCAACGARTDARGYLVASVGGEVNARAGLTVGRDA